MSSRANSTTYSTPFTKKPWGTKLWACFFLKTNITMRSNAMATHIQKMYWVRPTVVSPTMA
jgi:hypothetical protein